MSHPVTPSHSTCIRIAILCAVTAARGVGAASADVPYVHPQFPGAIAGGNDLVGHPTEAMLIAEGIAGSGDPFLPDPPLVSGQFINFESAPVKPLAYDAESSTLVAANTPNNSVVVFSVSDAGLQRVAEIPVGLEPVAVAFQPSSDSAERFVLVANFISDNVARVDLNTGQVVALREVGDEPVNIVVNAAGTHAFVVLQEGRLVCLDATTLAIVGETALDCNTPRAAAYDPVAQRLYVAALHSGNNTTVIGSPFVFRFDEPCTPDCPNECINGGTTCRTGIEAPVFGAALVFSVTASLFESTPMWPWPSAGSVAGSGSPPVLRITTDAGIPSAYADIVDIFSTDSGQPDPDVVNLWVQEWLAATGQTIVNAFGAVDLLIREYGDTDDHDVLVVDVSQPSSPQVVQIIANVGTTLTGLSRNPASGRLFVSNMQARNLTKHVQALRGHVVDHEVVILGGGPPHVAQARLDLHGGVPGFHNASDVNAEARRASLANPLEIVFNSSGTRAYLAALGPGRVAALNGTTGAVLGRGDVGRGPRGLVLDEARSRLYVLNRTDHTISIVEISGDALTQSGVVALFNPEPPVVRKGRDFLYSTRFSNNFATACATCHIDGHLDHLGWDLGDTAMTTLLPSPPITVSAPDPCETVITGAALSHPVKGPMVTQSLRGLADHAPFHWRGDKPEFVDFNEAFDGLLGGSELADVEMAAFDGFIKTVVYPPNPFRTRDNGFTNPNAANAITGYANSCHVCHQTQGAGALECAAVDGDVAFAISAVFQTQLVPQLRQIHKKFDSDRFNGFGLLHDGHEKRERNAHPIETFLIQFFPGLVPIADAMIAFLEAFPTNVAPVVGWQVLSAGDDDAQVLADVQLMIDQHHQSPSRCDVVAKGRRTGAMHGHWLISGPGDAALFQTDAGTTVTLEALLASGGPAAPLVFTAVPPGSGKRIGVDEDADGYLDALDPCVQQPNNGDVNADDITDFFDIDPFIAVLFSNGQVYNCGADVDGSGGVDFFDIDPFLAALFGG